MRRGEGRKLFHLLIANTREKAFSLSLSGIVSSDFLNDPSSFFSKKMFLGGRFKGLLSSQWGTKRK